jgi:transcriptional regulator with XRE-family HTH domain
MIRKRRKELGYTQAFLSDFSGLSVTFISDLENGKSTAELGKAIFLANLLGLDVMLVPRA